MMDYQPAEVAKRYMHLAQIWQPSVDSGIDMDLLRTWRAWIEANSKNLPIELERKIVASSNLVYATANDRSISAVPEHREFDLLIFEEAAKAYPLEVLGPMRLSRRWLLIGDHEQLSAFNIEDFRREAREATSRLYYATGGQSSRVQQQSRGMGLVSTSSRLATDVADFFEFLFTKGVKTGSNFADRLSLQWRMHPTISRMLREIYYDFLKDGDVDSLKVKHAHRISYPPEFRRNPIVWIDVPLSTETQSRGFVEELTAEVPFSGGGFINPFEARVLHNMMSKVQAAGRGGLAGNIAFLSPYKAQVDLINKFFKSWDRKRNPQTGDLRQKAFTVDSFQGRQEEVVVVSLVRNNREADGFDAYGFLEGEVGKARAAVMFSRAERLLIIIGCSKHFTKQFGFHIGRVFDYVEKHGVVIEAKNFLAAKDYEYLREHRDFDKQRQAERS
jgi:superfamily I DNA and/or RNA helicase